MSNHKKPVEKLIESLRERAKELNCLYRIEEILREPNEPLDSIFQKVVEAIPPGWQYPDVCQAKIVFEDQVYASPRFFETPWYQSVDIIVHQVVLGKISVYYTEEMPPADDGPFLKEESKLIGTIAERLGSHIMHQQMSTIVQELEGSWKNGASRQEWSVVLKMLRQTDRNLYFNIARKMLNHLCWSGIKEAEEFLHSREGTAFMSNEGLEEDWNQPHQRREIEMTTEFCEGAFRIAAESLQDEQILELVQRWIQEDKLSFLAQVVNRNLALAEVADAIRRYHHIAADDPDIFSPSKIGIHVSLIRRFLSDQLSYVSVAKDYIDVNDFYHLLQKMIFTTESHGKLGGKSAGLYLAAQIIRKKSEELDILKNIRIPRTWHVTSDILLHFMHYNNFDDVVEQKYKGINQVRLEYPHIVQTFKNARFPADIVKGLSVALDDFGKRPIIVRSSSLLEDRVGAAFSGKYKSLFLANQGTKQERLEALMDAIAEVYASTFSPDPIEYRTERGLIDFGEEMGIMIQEVVGKRYGRYFLPAYAGVAFSNNEFRWSPSIRREDGLIRLVPGLGTRAVDRLGNDYPVLVAPGQPGMRVNVTADEVVRYSPREIDVINLETNSFETIPIREFLREVGGEMKGVHNLVSVYQDGHLSQPSGLSIDYDNDKLVVTFEGLIAGTSFVKQIDAILKTLEQRLGYPVDIEFASDGQDFYLLQCRPQSHSDRGKPAPIPKDFPKKQIVFSANRFVSNGRVPDVTHIVYVDPKKYDNLPDYNSMAKVGRVVGKLNKLLPKRQFILMGPGRWGSRGDIKLGVSVTYSDISNTAVLIEIAFKKGNYLPDLSFGTHFFQDLVEANIRYLPLYPDDKGVEFNELFLTRSKNILADFLPEYQSLAEVVRLIDVPSNAEGRILRVLMNADLDEAMGVLVQPSTDTAPIGLVQAEEHHKENYWHWRLRSAEMIASQIDQARFGVAGCYIFGSTKNRTAGPASDIDLLIHFRGSPEQRRLLDSWLEGWSLSLADFNYLRTGYRTGGLLDVHYVTDEDIASKTSYALKIDAVTDAARPLQIGRQPESSQ
nr:nucleotidyltransferase domain-containing protein [candidate division Zixibacteria bacterium]